MAMFQYPDKEQSKNEPAPTQHIRCEIGGGGGNSNVPPDGVDMLF